MLLRRKAQKLFLEIPPWLVRNQRLPKKPNPELDNKQVAELYRKVTEQGNIEAQKIVEKFNERLTKGQIAAIEDFALNLGIILEKLKENK